MKIGNPFRTDAPLKGASLFERAIGIMGYHPGHSLFVIVRLPFLKCKEGGGLCTLSVRVEHSCTELFARAKRQPCFTIHIDVTNIARESNLARACCVLRYYEVGHIQAVARIWPSTWGTLRVGGA